jgi:hypothetical protein
MKVIRGTFVLPFLKLVSKIELKFELHFEKRNVCIPRSFLVINVCNQEKSLCSPSSSNSTLFCVLGNSFSYCIVV